MKYSFHLSMASTIFWRWVNLFGQAEVILPILLLTAVWLLWIKDTKRIQILGISLSFIAILTLISKIAFIGWGIGISAIYFMGISGHATLSGYVWPVLLGNIFTSNLRKIRRVLITLGYAIAILVTISTVMLKAHSLSEAIAGFMLGSFASFWVLNAIRNPITAPKWLLIIAALTLGILITKRPPFYTERAIAQIATSISNGPPHKRYSR